MSRIFKPRRGSRESAIDKNIILQDGEIYFEKPTTQGEYGKIVMGDGSTSYANLPYFLISNYTIPQIELNLTLNGAKEDNITIYDSNDNLLTTCIFNTNATSGTCTITITPDTEYKFVSSVSNYTKNVVLASDVTQVNCFPSTLDKMIYWYGNEFDRSWNKCGLYSSYGVYDYNNIGDAYAPRTFQKYTHELYFECRGNGYNAHMSITAYTSRNINLSNISKIICKGNGTVMAKAGTIPGSSWDSGLLINTSVPNTKKEINISSSSIVSFGFGFQYEGYNTKTGYLSELYGI